MVLAHEGAVSHTGVCCCVLSTAGYRSAKYVEQLIKQGIHAVNLRGSILAWVRLVATACRTHYTVVYHVCMFNDEPTAYAVT